MAYLVLNHHSFLSIRFRVKVAGKLIQCCEGTKVRAKKSGDTFIPDDPRAFEALEKWVSDITREIDAGEFSYLRHFPDGNKAKLFKPGGPRLFRDHAEQWLADKKNELESPSTSEMYEGTIDYHLNPIFGDLPLFEFSARPEKITSLLLDRLKVKRSRSKKNPDAIQEGGLSQRRKKAVFIILRAILATAKMDFPIPKFKGANRRRELAICEPHEVPLILKSLDPFYRPFYEFAFEAGPRPSEQIAIEVDSINWTYKLLPIFQKIVKGRKGKTKTEESERTIKLTPEMEGPLRCQIEIRKKIKADHNLLFCRPDGRPLNVEYLNRWVWKPAVKRAGLHYRPPISTRHTFATSKLSAGFSPGWVARIMGDNIGTVIKNYYHSLPGTDEPSDEPNSAAKRRKPRK